MATALEIPLEHDKKRPLDDDSDDDGFTLVTKKKDHKQTPPNASVTGTTKRIPPFDPNNPVRLKVLASSQAEAYRMIVDVEQRHMGLKMSGKPNLNGEWIITPHDVLTYHYLRSTPSLKIQELIPAEKTTKAVLRGFSRLLPIEAILNHRNVVNATRMKTRDGQETASILIEIKGPVPAKIHLGFLGVFEITAYTPEPMRCYRCQRFGHHKAQCTLDERCAICSGKHPSDICIKKHKEGKTTKARCPNCGNGHHAWSPRCPERLKRIHQRKGIPETKATESSTRPTTKTPQIAPVSNIKAGKSYAAAAASAEAPSTPKPEATKAPITTPATTQPPAEPASTTENTPKKKGKKKKKNKKPDANEMTNPPPPSKEESTTNIAIAASSLRSVLIEFLRDIKETLNLPVSPVLAQYVVNKTMKNLTAISQRPPSSSTPSTMSSPTPITSSSSSHHLNHPSTPLSSHPYALPPPLESRPPPPHALNLSPSSQ